MVSARRYDPQQYLLSLGFTDFVDVVLGDRSDEATRWCMINLGRDANIHYKGSGVDPMELMVFYKKGEWGSIAVGMPQPVRRFAFLPSAPVARVVEFKLLFGDQQQ